MLVQPLQSAHYLVAQNSIHGDIEMSLPHTLQDIDVRDDDKKASYIVRIVDEISISHQGTFITARTKGFKQDSDHAITGTTVGKTENMKF